MTLTREELMSGFDVKCPLCGRIGFLEAKLIHNIKGYTAIWCFCKKVISAIGMDPRPREIDIPLEVWDGTEEEAGRLGLTYFIEGEAERVYHPGDYTDSGEMWCGGAEAAEKLGLCYEGSLLARIVVRKGDRTQVGKTGITRLA